jgi:hypothetical protein
MNKETVMEKVAELEASQSVAEFRNWCADNDIKIYKEIDSALIVQAAERIQYEHQLLRDTEDER